MFLLVLVFIVPLTLLSGILLASIRFAAIIILGAYYVVRVDLSMFPRRLRRFDLGYEMFMASALLQHRHQNPVWNSFVQCVQHLHVRDQPSDATSEGSVQASNTSAASTAMRRKLAKNRWHLAVTLVNNPGLSLDRRQRPREVALTASDCTLTSETVVFHRERRRHTATCLAKECDHEVALDRFSHVRTSPRSCTSSTSHDTPRMLLSSPSADSRSSPRVPALRIVRQGDTSVPDATPRQAGCWCPWSP